MPEIPPLERLAQRICKAANAPDTKDASAIIALFKQRSRIAFVDAAVEFAVANEWLHFDGVTYTLAQGGAELGFQSRRGARTRRVMPF
jgi:hypothetical protein